MAGTDLRSVGPRYELRARLGAGGMGEVYRAWDRLEGREIALKRLLLPHVDVVQLGSDPQLQRAPASDATQEMSRIESGPAMEAPDCAAPPRSGPGFSLDVLEPSLPLSVLLTDSTLPSSRGTSGQPEAELRLALTQEFHTLASLRHPNIISVLDYGFDEERVPYFTMEFLADAQPISLAVSDTTLHERTTLLLQVLQALLYLHRRGILHREICKPNFV